MDDHKYRLMNELCTNLLAIAQNINFRAPALIDLIGRSWKMHRAIIFTEKSGTKMADGAAVADDHAFTDRQLTIMSVDDNLTCLKILEAKLLQCKYHVISTNSAMGALNILRAKEIKIDIIITDVHMPDMDGFGLLEQVGSGNGPSMYYLLFWLPFLHLSKEAATGFGFVCGVYGQHNVGEINCRDVKGISEWDLNYLSISVPVMNKEVVVRRIVTNVGKAVVDMPEKFKVRVRPEVLKFWKVNEKKTFTVRVMANGYGEGNFLLLFFKY